MAEDSSLSKLHVNLKEVVWSPVWWVKDPIIILYLQIVNPVNLTPHASSSLYDSSQFSSSPSSLFTLHTTLGSYKFLTKYLSHFYVNDNSWAIYRCWERKPKYVHKADKSVCSYIWLCIWLFNTKMKVVKTFSLKCCEVLNTLCFPYYIHS